MSENIPQKASATSDILRKIKAFDQKKMTLGELSEQLHEGGFSLILLVFALPMAIPLPAAGIGTVLGWPILLVGVQLLMGRKTLWLPAWIARKNVSMGVLKKAIDWVLPLFNRLEYFIKPRLLFMTSRWGDKLTGLICVLCAISALLPFPFTNTTPSAGVVLMAVGLLERDGVLNILGILLGLLGCTIAVLVILLGAEAVKALF